MITRAQNLFSAIFFIVFSVVIYISSNNIKSMTDINVGPDFFPKAASILLFILSLFLLIQEVYKWIKNKSIQQNGEKNKQNILKYVFQKEHINAFLTVVIFVSYVYFIPRIGFLLSTITYLLLHFFVLSNKRNWNVILFIILSLFVSIIIFYTFRLGFSVRLPTL